MVRYDIRYGDQMQSTRPSMMATLLDKILERPVTSYSNSGTSNTPDTKRPRSDMADCRQYWVENCSATLPRNDVIASKRVRRQYPRSTATYHGHGLGQNGGWGGGRGGPATSYMGRGSLGARPLFSNHGSRGVPQLNPGTRNHFSYWMLNLVACILRSHRNLKLN